MIKGIPLFSMQKIFICLLISACHLIFMIIFYCHEVINTFIQWKETISVTYLTDTPSCLPFIEANVYLLPQVRLTSIPRNALIGRGEGHMARGLHCSRGSRKVSQLNFFYIILLSHFLLFFSINFLPLTCSIRNVRKTYC